jgi:hypothetical protein
MEGVFMGHSLAGKRPSARIDRILSRLRRIWHYYPEHSLPALVLETTIYANHVESDLPLTGMGDIEDIPYPEGHRLHGSRNLEMGLDWLEKFHENEPLPPVPIQTAHLGNLADRWRRQPEMRLGQLLTNAAAMAERESAIA